MHPASYRLPGSLTRGSRRRSSLWKARLDRLPRSVCLCSLCRLAKAIEKLQSFSLAADPSFRHFHSDASKEVKLIHGLEFIRGRPFC